MWDADILILINYVDGCNIKTKLFNYQEKA